MSAYLPRVGYIIKDKEATLCCGNKSLGLRLNSRSQVKHRDHGRDSCRLTSANVFGLVYLQHTLLLPSPRNCCDYLFKQGERCK
ncbi:hypothetical protein ANANG_G00233370 [Anguilla anguilla]|uniref:Uncharacterized protein n=1 Tax=Anguilla anguilla TaxID=7936 RepID=A0A9D3RN83_ANGAN|nr:hypothetical protein ANANG_G00233370 [Anguilla anguilla]